MAPWLYQLFVLMLWLPLAPVYADISIDRALVEFFHDESYYSDVNVHNHGKSRAYVAVSVLEVVNPGHADERRLSGSQPESALLVASPTRLVVEPGSSVPIRLHNLDESHDCERVYRVLIEPVTGKINDKRDSVRVLVSYDILVTIRPRRTVVHVLAERRGAQITFYNSGNSHIVLEDGKQCTGQSRDCQKIQGARLYAGTRWTTELPQAGAVSFLVNSGKTLNRQTFTGEDRLPDTSTSAPRAIGPNRPAK